VRRRSDHLLFAKHASALYVLRAEVARRRTFAIIAHPDAGKTTLTEKLLLYGGAIHLAGTVKQKRASRWTTSDWMALERERGISVSTSVMQFEHCGFQINTPGHNDFSEDTYRTTLSAVDSAVMLVDGAKGRPRGIRAPRDRPRASHERWLDERTARLRRRLATTRREASTQEMIEIAAGARARRL
jgi:hypothetical protein